MDERPASDTLRDLNLAKFRACKRSGRIGLIVGFFIAAGALLAGATAWAGIVTFLLATAIVFLAWVVITPWE